MSRKNLRLLIAVSVLFIFGITSAFAQPLKFESHTKYTLYIGLNDGNTGKPTFDLNDAGKVFRNIAGKFVDGYTLYHAEGFWHEGDKTFGEKTLVCVIVDADEESVKRLMNEALKVFRQSSILIEKGKTESTFYSGE